MEQLIDEIEFVGKTDNDFDWRYVMKDFIWILILYVCFICLRCLIIYFTSRCLNNKNIQVNDSKGMLVISTF